MRANCLVLALFFLIAAAPAPVALDKRAVLSALAVLSDTKIPRDKLHCEFNGTVEKKNGSFSYNDIRVRDFFVKYVIWGQMESPSKTQDLTCEGDGKQTCRWWFGEKEDNRQPGWSAVLNFVFDPKAKTVVPASLECIQVP